LSSVSLSDAYIGRASQGSIQLLRELELHLLGHRERLGAAFELQFQF
jgi:hypothetical protein